MKVQLRGGRGVLRCSGPGLALAAAAAALPGCLASAVACGLTAGWLTGVRAQEEDDGAGFVAVSAIVLARTRQLAELTKNKKTKRTKEARR